MEKDTSVIPCGLYCETFGADAKICPHWSSIPELPEGENGFCSYLDKSDFDLNEEIGDLEEVSPKSGKTAIKINAHDCFATLLWDKVKMCGINVNDPDEELESEYDIKYGAVNFMDFNDDERQE